MNTQLALQIRIATLVQREAEAKRGIKRNQERLDYYSRESELTLQRIEEYQVELESSRRALDAILHGQPIDNFVQEAA